MGTPLIAAGFRLDSISSPIIWNNRPALPQLASSPMDAMRPPPDLTEHVKLMHNSAFGGYGVVWMARLEMGEETSTVIIF